MPTAVPRLNVQFSKNVRDELKDDLIDIARIVGETGSEIRQRVQETGKSASGTTFPRYAKATQRAKASRRPVVRAGGKRNFTQTGQMWASLRVRVKGPGKYQVEFSGKRASGGDGRRFTNKKISEFQYSRDKNAIRQPMIDASEAEVSQLERRLAASVEAATLESAAAEQRAVELEARVQRLERRASKVRR